MSVSVGQAACPLDSGQNRDTKRHYFEVLNLQFMGGVLLRNYFLIAAAIGLVVCGRVLSTERRWATVAKSPLQEEVIGSYYMGDGEGMDIRLY
ncbi:MAG: hypothetical protein WAU88_06120, partial [Candidatus Zixiibacteriota bacterium]